MSKIQVLRELKLLEPVLLDNLDELIDVSVHSDDTCLDDLHVVKAALQEIISTIKLHLEDDGDFAFDDYQNNQLGDRV